MTDYILNISVDKLKPNPLNEQIYSFNQTDHDELKKSVELNGLLEPITITQNNTIVSGHRRYGVVKDLGWEFVDCRLSEFDNLTIATIELNRYRKKTTQEILNEMNVLKIEYSTQVKRGRPKNGEKKTGRNWTILNVSSKLGVSTTKLKKLMSIESYEPELLTKIDMGLISVGKAYTIIREKYILNGNGGRPKKDFQSQFSQLLDEYKPSLKQIVKVMKQKPSYKEELKSSFN